MTNNENNVRFVELSLADAESLSIEDRQWWAREAHRRGMRIVNGKEVWSVLLAQ